MAKCSLDIKFDIIDEVRDTLNRDGFIATSKQTLDITDAKRAKEVMDAVNSKFGEKVVTMSYTSPNTVYIEPSDALVREYYEDYLDKMGFRQLNIEEQERGGYTEEQRGEFFQLNDGKVLEKAIPELDNYLLNFMKQFGVKSKEFNELKSRLGLDAFGATDVLNKLIWYTKNRNEETIPEEVGHMAVMLMGEEHPDIKELLKEITSWSEYNDIKKQYFPIYKNEKQVKIEAVGKLIAKALVRNYKVSGLDQSLLQKALSSIREFIEKILDSLNISDAMQYNDRVADHVAINLLMGNKDYIAKIKNTSKKLDYRKALENNPFAQFIINTFTKFNFKLTGSLAIAGQGEIIYRPSEEPIHDIDFNVNSFEEYDKIEKTLEDLNAVPYHFGWDNAQKDYKTFAFLIPKKGFTIQVISRDFEKGNGWVTDYKVLNENGKEVQKNAQNHVAVDFFVYKNGIAKSKNSIFKSVVDIYNGKLTLSRLGNEERMFQREKDRQDYILHTPKTIQESLPQFTYLQTEEMPMSKASPETIEKVKELAKSVGINFQDLLTYAKGNPTVDVKNATGLADLTKGIIALATGREDVAITEEFVHIATAIIEQVNPALVTEMIAKIDRFKIYKQTLEAYKNNKNYQLSNGKPDIRKIKKEAVDKLIAEVIISQEQGGETDFPDLLKETDMSIVRMWWNYILDKIRGIYNSSNIDVFRNTASLITKGEIGGTVADIKEAGIFLQQKNEAVDKLYNTIIEEDSKLELIPATYDAQGNVIKKRHYTDQGEEVAKTVTELLDEEDKMVDRTEFQKSQDKQKMNWGDKGHVFIYNVLSNDLLDKDGYALANPKTSDVKTPLNENIQMHIRSFLTELIASYKPGTRFIIEKKAINRKVKGKLASTIDFIAIEPNEKTGVKVDTLDWKFTSINKAYQEDVPWYKSKKWIKQMAEYVKMLYNYGLKPNQLRKSRMVPFQANYLYQSEGDPKSGLVLNSLEIGKLDSAKETNFYLLPVPLPTESTGSAEIDKLIKSLREYYEKLYNKPVSPEERYAKILYTNELAKAIRALHVKIDFKPLASIGDTFLRGAAKTFKGFENIDYTKLTDDEIRGKLKELLEFQKSAEKFATLDDAFLSHFPKEGLSEEDRKTLSKLVEVSSATGRMMNKIIELQHQYVIQLAASKGVNLPVVEDDAGKKKIQAEVEIKGLAKTFLEGSQLSAKLINIGSNLLMNAQSLVNIEANKLIDRFGKKLLALEEEVRGSGKTAFDMIGTVQGDKLKLIRKIDKRFWENVSLAKEAKDKQWLMDNMDVEKYNKLAQEAINKGRDELEKITFSTDLEEDSAERNYRVQKLIDSLDINSPTFNGYDGYQFAYIFNRSIYEDQHLSPEYQQMAKSQNALEVWKFFTELNERAKAAGYLVEEGISFFPLMEATMLQKLSASDSVVRQMKDFWKDGFSVRVNEQQTYSKTDPETGELKKQIPTLFTRTDKAVDQLSRDLNKVGSLWIRSLLEYETSKNLEDILLTLHSVEKSKGSIIVDEGQKIIWEGGAPKITQKSNKNADIMQTIIDDGLYGISENLSSLGNVVLGTTTEKLTKGDDEKKETRALAAKKVTNNANKLTQALAVGLRATVAIPNYFGFHFQTYANSGGFYRFGEFEKNNVKTTLGNLNTIQKGLLDLITPLNEDISKEKMRKLAKQQGYIKWLSTWNFTDVMMVTNSFPERKLQFANALSFIDNAMVVDGKIVNIRQYVRAQDQARYRKDASGNYLMSQAERKELENSFEERVQKLKETSSLEKIAKIENDEIVIPGVSTAELAKFRTTIVEFGRNLNGQMNSANKADYRRDTIFRSFMMFKTWIPKQASLRTLDIKKNIELDEWTYGRSRAFIKTWANLGFTNILKMRQIIQGTDEGLAILDEMLEAKREDYYKKTGQQLEITNEEFYDLMRRELGNQLKELKLLFGLVGVVVAAKIAAPDDEEDPIVKNQYKYILKMVNKISDEISFYYNPLTLETMTKGSILPSLGLLTRAEKVIEHTLRYGYGEFSDDQEVIKDAHPLKYFLDFIPGPSQFNKEILPLIDPELAKELGIRVTSQSR